MTASPEAGDDPQIVQPPTEADLQATLAYRVRFDEATPTGAIRTSVLLRYAADLAAVHSDRRGFGREWYRRRGLAWLVRGVDLELHGPIRHGDEIVGTTRAVAARKVLARRLTEFVDAAGRPVATLVVDWALTSVDGVPTRIPPVFDSVFGMTVRSFEPIRVRALPPAGSPGVDRRVRPQELDPMDHVNNAVYLDWAEEAIQTIEPASAASRRAATTLAPRVPRLGRAWGRRPHGVLAGRDRLVRQDRRRGERRPVRGRAPYGLTGPSWVVGPGTMGGTRCAGATKTAPSRTGPPAAPDQGPGRPWDVRPRTTPYDA